MRNREWKEYFRREMHDTECKFESTVQAMLQGIREAEPKDRPALAASFGGFVRSHQSGARLVLAKAMMEQLHITTTQHVACMVMKTVFGTAASTNTLDACFAKSGRTANEKHVETARQALHQHPDQVKRYAGLYRWYCGALNRRIKVIKATAR